MAGLRLVRVFCGRRHLMSWPLNEVRNQTTVKKRKVGISDWKTSSSKAQR